MRIRTLVGAALVAGFLATQAPALAAPKPNVLPILGGLVPQKPPPPAK